MIGQIASIFDSKYNRNLGGNEQALAGASRQHECKAEQQPPGFNDGEEVESKKQKGA